MPDLENVLNDEPVEEVAEPVVAEETTETEEESTGEPEVEATAETEEAGSPPEPKQETGMVPISALLDEREKRQSLQKQLETQPQVQAPPLPDIFESQEAFAGHLQQQFDNRASQIETAMNLKFARMQHADYDDKAARFQELAAQNPLLGQQAMQSGNAPEFAYKHVEQQEKLDKLNDPKQFEEMINQEVERRLKEAGAQELTKEIDEKTAPPSLSNQRAAGGNSSKEYAGPPSLESVLK